ncbi:MAG: amino acid ABC transporter substrate-binding protein [Rhodobacter sp.]|jgi:polar amino acid transport system substrate-binding protein|nr:amino acid ABC transporter substrate-binding protein [Rhodobacter sp.]MCA3453145.1 amino acid ABC transporter substrate-binding protein [Rhodobacter sp.]MCA3457906.1 amino acid ABC transporter substrate-binding protein [Rhodobacter sp.]MCA3460624.1 amino acid ABC transporter substrate-binding protein [Rhodobacter sp.]MCA3463089.1 amino acid ABC transporter substrate-binding protein [Rhodobacter sp.]
MTMMTRLATATGLVLLGLSVPALAEGFGECKVTGTAGSIQIPTVTEGTLTVAAILPAPDSFKGNSPETITGGFEYCLAAEIAHRAGLKSVTVQNVPWPALIAGQLSGFDTAMTNIFITEERLQNVDFTAPYFVATSGVMVRSEDAATITRDNLGEKRLGVFLASVQDRFLDQTLKPTGEVRRFEATADMFTALSAGQIDAVLFDLSGVLPAATASNGALTVIGQYDVGGNVGGVLVKGSQAKAGFDAAIEAMKADGTIDQLVATWYAPLWGVDPATIPYWDK